MKLTQEQINDINQEFNVELTQNDIKEIELYDSVNDIEFFENYDAFIDGEIELFMDAYNVHDKVQYYMDMDALRRDIEWEDMDYNQLECGLVYTEL